MTDRIIDVRRGDELDWARLEAYLRERLEVPDGSMSVRQFTGGRANLTYHVCFGEQVSLVVRRPPRGSLAAGAHDMNRESRILARLSEAYPRAPRALHYCPDPSVIGAPFSVIEYREGVVIRHEVPGVMAHHQDAARRIDLAFMDAVADLHRVDWSAAGLDGLGRPDGYAARQVQGWTRRWKDATDKVELPAMDVVADRLLETLPEPSRATVVHNDLKLDNCQFQPTDPDTVTSVFDWDMATLGDPMFDLGLLLVAMASMPAWVLTIDEAVARYASRADVDVSRIDWYVGFATWRTAVVMQQLYSRYVAGNTSDDRVASFADAIPDFAERALDLVTRAG